MKFFLTIFMIYVSVTCVHSIETKIVHRIQNEIITNIDIKNEFKYLLALNNNLKGLDKEKIFKISNESIIRERIKKIEVSKNFKEIEVNSNYLKTLIKNTYSSLGLNSKEEFTIYLRDYGLTLNDVEKKLTVNALWNELIYKKYNSQITIDEEKIKNEIKNSEKKIMKEYHLSEIIFEVKSKDNIKKKHQIVINSINEIGFENSASIYSISESSKIGGDIGWVKENLLNTNIKENINNLSIGEISEPIIISNGILILKVTNIKNSEISLNYELEFKKIFSYEKNRQLNQYSKIYFDKVKKNLTFNE